MYQNLYTTLNTNVRAKGYAVFHLEAWFCLRSSLNHVISQGHLYLISLTRFTYTSDLRTSKIWSFFTLLPACFRCILFNGGAWILSYPVSLSPHQNSPAHLRSEDDTILWHNYYHVTVMAALLATIHHEPVFAHTGCNASIKLHQGSKNSVISVFWALERSRIGVYEWGRMGPGERENPKAALMLICSED